MSDINLTGNFKHKKLFGLRSYIFSAYKKILNAYKWIKLKEKNENYVLSAREEWIYDNFYYIRKQFGDMFSSFDGKCRVPSVKLGAIYLPEAFVNALEISDFRDTKKAIKDLGKRIKLNSEECDKFIFFLKCAYIVKLSKCVTENEDNFETLLCGLKSTSDVSSDFISENLSVSHGFLKSSSIYTHSDSITKSIYRFELEKKAKENNVSICQYVISLQKDYADITEALTPMPKYDLRRSFYFISLYLITVLSVTALCFAFDNLFPVLFSLPIYSLAKEIVNYTFLRCVKPKYLPRFESDFVSDIPCSHVIPVLLIGNPEKEITEKLENAYLRNRNGNLFFGVLCDFNESEKPEMSDDKLLCKTVENTVGILNAKYGERFFAIIRPRVFSRTQNKYIGRERKRGAITDFCRYIYSGKGNFYGKFGCCDKLNSCKYFTVTDFDTDITADSILNLLSVITHPANKEYGAIVPQLKYRTDKSKSTLFQEIISEYHGTEYYSMPYAELNDSLFSKSIFSGKGMINVEAYIKNCIDLPEERILSHDFIEGALLNTGSANDIVFFEEQPQTFLSYQKREHRWVRGDWQSSLMLLSKKLSVADKYILMDNLVHSMDELSYVVLFILFAFIDPVLLLIALCFYYIKTEFPLRMVLYRRITSGINSINTVKYYSRISQPIKLKALNVFYRFLSLPFTAVNCTDAAVRALFRQYISGKKLLEWTTARDSDRQNSDFKKYVFPLILSLIILGVSICGYIYYHSFVYIILSVLSAAWFISPLLFCFLSNKTSDKKTEPKETDREKLYSYALDMWNFYRENLKEEYNWLIPDNIQEDPPLGAAIRTSPTNIGFSILAIANAKELGIISDTECENHIGKILDSVDKLKKYNGHLLNWYEITTLKPLEPQYVSFVDSGNFSVCLLTAAGIIDSECLSERLVKTALQSDFPCLYDNKKHLYHIGIETKTGNKGRNYYDLLASESRLTVFFLVAFGNAPVKAWQALSRITVKEKNHYGLCSWGGTAFEFFLPEIFLKTQKGTLLNEALYFAINAQKERCKGFPYGISEGCFYSFSKDYAYKYKAMGVQKVGLKNRLDSDFTVSPYSSFLMLDSDFESAMNNLDELKKAGLTGKFGFYESIDYKRGGKIIKSYMAHHIGMSFSMLANLLCDDVNRKSFMSIPQIRAYNYLTEESVSPYAIGREKLNYVKPKPQKKNSGFASTDYFSSKGMVLSNGHMTTVILDTGAGFTKFNSLCLTKYRRDLYFNPQGVFFLAEINGKTVSLSDAPFYNESHTAKISHNSVILKTEYSSLQFLTEIFTPPNINCEIRDITVFNSSSSDITFDLFAYTEPVICEKNREGAHPAYNGLMIEASEAENETAVIFTRRDFENKAVSLCMGIADCKSEFETVKERLLPKFTSTSKISVNKLNVGGISNACINPVFCQKTLITVKGNGRKTVRFIMAAGYDKCDAEIEYKKGTEYKHTENGADIPENLHNIIPSVFFDTPKPHNHNLTGYGINDLWKHGISGKNEIIAINCDQNTDVNPYLELYAFLEKANLHIDMVFIFDDIGYDRPIYSRINSSAEENHCETYLGKGIYTVDKESGKFIKSVSSCILFDGTENALPQYSVPIKIDKTIRGIFESGFANNGFFVGNGNEVTWSHVLTNGNFGTVMTNNSLGFSFCSNAGLYKISRWNNDAVTDNLCEKLYLKSDGKYYDIIYASSALFRENSVVYTASVNGIDISVNVFVSAVSNEKILDIKVNSKRKAELMYAVDLLMGDNLAECPEHIQSIRTLIGLFFVNPVNEFYPQRTVYLKGGDNSKYSLSRTDFISGKESHKITENGFGAVYEKIQPGESSFRFILGCESSILLAKHEKTAQRPYEIKNPLNISTKNSDLDDFINAFSYKQIVDARLKARAGFYQVSGAYGFRDQLQDAMCISTVNIKPLKRQIIRCCMHQFTEGDVMHWWHEITPFVKSHRGVRTKCSDDMLWLPLAVAEYFLKTGDIEFLNMNLPYLTADKLKENENDRYINAEKSDIVESVYSHCIRALEKGYNPGDHGLLLIGSGDWNDGLSSAGKEGKGESVWLSMFYICVCNKFKSVLECMHDKTEADLLKKSCDALKDAVEKFGWDGEYYLRGYFDNGNPFGSHENTECTIDLMPQTFASLAECFDVNRVKSALDSLENLLVDRKHRIIKLFKDPFVNTEYYPGYIQNYVGGVRENGGQYTHAASFYIYSLFKRGDTDKAYDLLCMITPSLNNTGIYKNEPYVLSGDVYSADGFEGRGGWSWYTGSAGWYYKTVIEEMLGVKRVNDRIYFNPKLPKVIDNMKYKIIIEKTEFLVNVIRNGQRIIFENGAEINSVELDGRKHKITVMF